MMNPPSLKRTARGKRVRSFLPHALFSFQRVLDLANARPQEIEMRPHELISYGPQKDAKRILEIDCTIGGVRYADVIGRMEAIKQIQSAVRRVLDRYIDGAPDPLRDPKKPKFNPRTRRMDPLFGEKDFVVRGRRPLQDTRVFLAVVEGHSLPDVSDLQDYWYVQVVNLLVGLRRKEPLIIGKRSGRLRIPFRPLGRCDVWWKIPVNRRVAADDRDHEVCGRFFFRVRPDQATCGRRKCIERHKYLRRHSL